MTGSGPAPVMTAGSSVMLMLSGAVVTVAVICVLTSADVLFNSLDSTMRLFGSTTAVFVIMSGVGMIPGVVVLIVIVPFDPAFTAPPAHVTVLPTVEQLNRLVPVTDVIASASGTVSTTTMSVAFCVPVLFTVSV